MKYRKFNRLLLALLMLPLYMGIATARSAGEEVTVGFTQNPSDPLELTVVAHPNFTASGVSIPAAQITVLLPQGTGTDPAVPVVPASGSFTDRAGGWTVSLITPGAYGSLLGLDPNDLEGNDVYQAVMSGAATGLSTVAGQPIELFRFRLPGNCTGGSVAVMTNGSPIQQALDGATGADFGNALWISDTNAYVGNHASTASLPCPLGASSDSDGDGVSNDDETNILGTDPDDPDSDSSNTVPEDENDNGTTDGDEDLDGDGHRNVDELDAGSDPLDRAATPADLDGDGVRNVDEDLDGDGEPANEDTDGDGTPDYLDADDDGDGIPTAQEIAPQSERDADGDGIPDYLDAASHADGAGDSDGDGVLDSAECPGGIPCPDPDGDGIPAYMDEDEQYMRPPLSDRYYLPIILAKN